MTLFRFSTISTLILGVFVSSTAVAQAQGIEDAKAKLPVFTTEAVGQKAEQHIYYPSVNVMVKIEATAISGLFSEVEFGYLVGDFESVVAQILAEAWYSGYDEASIAGAARQLQDEAKTMRQPFQPPVVTLSVALDAAGVTFTYKGRTPEGSEVSTSFNLTWAQIVAQS
jgi:hypothetical protein